MAENMKPSMFDFTRNFKLTFPYEFFGPHSPQPPQVDEDEVKITEDCIVAQTRVEAFRGNELDRVLSSDNYGFFKPDRNPLATLVFFSRERVREIMLNPHNAPKEAANLVIIKKDGSMFPGFIPDFGDFALLPKALKIVLRWMFETSFRTPPVLRRLWLATSPRIPPTTNETVIHYGWARFSCYSYPSRLHLFTVPIPSKKRISLEVNCNTVSSSPMDGRQYNFQVDVGPKRNLKAGIEWCDGEKFEIIDRPKVKILVWNCLGVGRPCFLGNLKHLKDEHRPEIIVLLETRMSRTLLPTVLRDMRMFKLVGMSPATVYGGIAILSSHNKVQFVHHDMNEGKVSGCLKGIKLLYI